MAAVDPRPPEAAPSDGILTCPKCRKKNQPPDGLRVGGRFRCCRCHAPLTLPRPAGPASRVSLFTPPPRWLTLLLSLYAAVLLLLTVLNVVGPERWWLGSLNEYLPQCLWAAPGLALLTLTLWTARRWAWVPLLSLLWVLGPLMGWCWHAPNYHSPWQAGVPLRVMTYNVKWGSRDAGAIVADVQAYRPDVIQLQDSAWVLSGPIGKALAGWNVRTSGQYIVASRLPFSELESCDLSFPGYTHHCVRYTINIGGRPVTLYDAHLLSPRNGLSAVRHRQFSGITANVEARQQQAAKLASYLGREQGPLLLTGDLNAPVQSQVLRGLCRTGLRDAFSAAGRGYGYSYGAYTRVGRPYVRIDHILASPQWRIENCWVGNQGGSDHCPVIADLFLPAPDPVHHS